MKIDVRELQDKIRVNNAAAQAKKMGAQVSAEVAAIIRDAWRAKVPISVIRESLRDMGVPMSPTMVSKIAKSPTPRRKRGLSAQVGAPSVGETVGGQSAPIEQLGPCSGVVTLPSDHSSTDGTGSVKRPFANLTKVNASA
jgi:hypothetical protein